jgi:Pyruvate/2-oxoacid:ferredoxin oxidoreductase gamma subunit
MDDKEIVADVVVDKILVVRGKKVMLDRNLAQLYGVPVKRLNEQVKRNIKRFPEDFMFQLTKKEAEVLRSQNATLNDHAVNKRDVVSKRGKHLKYMPFVFTEQGVAMLSTVLNSEQAIMVNIAIIRVFVKLREFLLTHKELAEKLEELEKKYQLHEKDIQVIFEAIKKLLEPPPESSKPKIGFHP